MCRADPVLIGDSNMSSLSFFFWAHAHPTLVTSVATEYFGRSIGWVT